MSTNRPRKLSFLEKVVIVSAFCRALGSGLWALILSPLRGKNGAPSITTHVKLAMGRSLLKKITIAQSQALNPLLETAYPEYAQKVGFEPETVTMKDGTKAYWFGNSKSKDVLIWFHSGGYALPPEPGHLIFALALANHAKVAGKDLGILMPEYTLAPQAHYPRQMQQGIETLRYTIEILGRDPSNIFIGGDSAGGNLTLAILSHILHPHPTCPPLPLSAPLKGVILLAPWASFDTTWDSCTTNANKDVVTKYIADTWSASFLGPSAREEYNEPIRADVEWWSELPKIAGEILTVGGRDEILVDSIRVMAGKLEAAHPKTTLLIAPDEFHDQCTSSLGTPGKGQQGEAIKNWVTSRL